MTKLIWKPDANLRYELGVDRGVLYPDGADGVAWSGIVEVNESILGSERSEYYNDGVKFMEEIGSKVYQGSIKAFSAPDEFNACIGIKDVVKGFSLTRQPRKRFGFSYRTQIGTLGYKIHLIYNATATPTAKNYASQAKNAAPLVLEWKIDAVPPNVSPTFKATAHFVIDSTKATPSSLALLEASLYGTSSAAPYLPDVTTLINLFQN
jgi:hypothetical protein